MIDLVNKFGMSLEQRRASLQRALHSQSFFALLDMIQIGQAQNFSQYGAKVGVDKDFWVTEIKGDFGEEFNLTNTYFNMNLYIANKGLSLNRYIAGEDLPTQFQCDDIKETSSGSYFADTQREIMPTLVKRNDAIIARVKNLSPKAEPATIKIVVAGYYPLEDVTLPDRQMQGINEALQFNPIYEQWHVATIDYDGQREVIINNDRFPRMILGFGIRIKTVGSVSQGTLQIYDAYRGIRLNNDPINMAFFAPKQPLVADVPIYYLPIEHFWETLAPMKFTINNTLNRNDAGYDLYMLTRTV